LVEPGDFKEAIAEKQIKERTMRKSQPRCISSHVVSRWYRPPEIIMVEPNYNTSADMWSLGCILAEMLHCTYKARPLNQRFLFAGTSSFPLSPCHEMKNAKSREVNIISSRDQLKLILDKLGKQDK